MYYLISGLKRLTTKQKDFIYQNYIHMNRMKRTKRRYLLQTIIKNVRKYE